MNTLKEDLHKTHVPFAGHTLNLSVQAALSVKSIPTPLAHCRNAVAHFNQSRLDKEELFLKQQQSELPQHPLIKDVETRWNLTYQMIKRLCEQQAAIAAVLLPERDLSYLEIASEEWRIFEDIAEVLEPFQDATAYLSADSYRTISALSHLFNEIQCKVTL